MLVVVHVKLNRVGGRIPLGIESRHLDNALVLVLAPNYMHLPRRNRKDKLVGAACDSDQNRVNTLGDISVSHADSSNLADAGLPDLRARGPRPTGTGLT